MSVITSCPQCKKHYRVPATTISRRVQCTQCHHQFSAEIAPPPVAAHTKVSDEKTVRSTLYIPTRLRSWIVPDQTARVVSGDFEPGVLVGIVGSIAGALIGWLLSPSIPFTGERLGLEDILTRGATLQGMDELLVPLAERSFNTILLFGIVGLLVSLAILRAKKKMAA